MQTDSVYVNIYNRSESTMQINTNRKKRVLVISLIIAAAGLLTFVILKNQGVFNEYESQTDSSDIKNSDSSKNQKDNSYNDNEKPINDPQQNINHQTSEITGFITSSNVSGDNLVLRIQINELLSNGSCSLILSNSARSVTKTSGVIDSATSSSCYGFDIPLSELSNGTWQIKVTVTSGDRTGIITGEVNI